MCSIYACVDSFFLSPQPTVLYSAPATVSVTASLKSYLFIHSYIWRLLSVGHKTSYFTLNDCDATATPHLEKLSIHSYFPTKLVSSKHSSYQFFFMQQIRYEVTTRFALNVYHRSSTSYGTLIDSSGTSNVHQDQCFSLSEHI